MTNKVEDAGQAAGGTTHVSTAQIGLLIEVAVIAMQHSQALLEIKAKNRMYLDALIAYESAHGRVEGRIDPKNWDHREIIAATKAEFADLERAKRNAYNIGRRLSTACRKAGHINPRSPS